DRISTTTWPVAGPARRTAPIVAPLSLLAAGASGLHRHRVVRTSVAGKRPAVEVDGHQVAVHRPHSWRVHRHAGRSEAPYFWVQQHFTHSVGGYMPFNDLAPRTNFGGMARSQLHGHPVI